MSIEATERMEVNVFMSLGGIPEYAAVLMDRYELVVKVLYYRADNDEMNDIDLDNVEGAKSFKCSDLTEAERKYAELNDAHITIPIILEYLKNRNN